MFVINLQLWPIREERDMSIKITTLIEDSKMKKVN